LKVNFCRVLEYSGFTVLKQTYLLVTELVKLETTESPFPKPN